MKARLSLLALAAGAFIAAPAAAQQVTFMTGPQGGSWIPLGGALKGMWEKNIPGLRITQTPGAGIANVRGVDEGKADIGLANSITTVLTACRARRRSEEGHQRLPAGHPVPAVLPGGRARRRQASTASPT